MNVDATLRRIDEEIVDHRQQIAAHQVAIMRLEDSRKVLMGLAEGDQIAAEMARAERTAAPGEIYGHGRRMLIVRRTGSGDEGPPPAPKKAKAKKTRDYDRERAKAAELQRKREQGEAPPPATRVKRQYTSADVYGGGKVLQEKVVALVKKTGPIASREIGNRLNIPQGTNDRQPLSNALWTLKAAGVLQRDDHKLYSLTHSGMQ